MRELLQALALPCVQFPVPSSATSIKRHDKPGVIQLGLFIHVVWAWPDQSRSNANIGLHLCLKYTQNVVRESELRRYVFGNVHVALQAELA